jgi:hypothetical protein
MGGREHFSMQGESSSNNCLAGRVDGIRIEGADPAVEAHYAPGNGNRSLIEFVNGSYGVEGSD